MKAIRKKVQTLDEMMKRRAKRKAAFETTEINREHIKCAVIEYLERLPTFQLREIVDIDIPALSTDLVKVNIYTKE